jgi:hypothetical protein
MELSAGLAASPVGAGGAVVVEPGLMETSFESGDTPVLLLAATL